MTEKLEPPWGVSAFIHCCTGPGAHIYGLLTGLTMYQTLGAADFCSFELDSASELVVSVPRLWLLLPSSPLDSVVAVIATFREVVSG